MTKAIKSDWIESHELTGFFGSEPVGKDELSEVYCAESGSFIFRFEICQADRFASLELREKTSDEVVLTIQLPNYAWIKLSDPDSTLTIGPPRSELELTSGGGVTVCPVVVRIRPFVRIEFDRKHDRLRFR